MNWHRLRLLPLSKRSGYTNSFFFFFFYLPVSFPFPISFHCEFLFPVTAVVRRFSDFSSLTVSRFRSLSPHTAVSLENSSSSSRHTNREHRPNTTLCIVGNESNKQDHPVSYWFLDIACCVLCLYIVVYCVYV